MSEIIVAFGDAAQQSATRNVLTSASVGTLSGLVNEAGVTTSVGLEITAPASSTGVVSIGAGNTQGTGDASWVLPWMNYYTSGALDTSASPLQGKFTGLDPAKQYRFEVNGITSSGDGVLASEVFGADKLTHAVAGNTTLTNNHAPVSPNGADEISFSLYRDSGSALGAAVFRLVEFVPAGPAITVTQTELTPGGTISGTYSNYATIPTTLTVSDGTNTITVPVTIDDTAKTFSGTMPALPTTGTASLVLFGDVTVELT